MNRYFHNHSISYCNLSHLIDFKEGGREYFEKMCNGYISYYRGANPLLFAIRNELGEIPPGLIFTKCIRWTWRDRGIYIYEE